MTYRPRSTFKALGLQYFHYGRWRRVVARHHTGTINLRYLAPPAMVIGTSAAILVGILWWPAWLVPAAYGLAIGAGGLLISRGEPLRARLLTPLMLGVMQLVVGDRLPDQPADARTVSGTLGAMRVLMLVWTR